MKVLKFGGTSVGTVKSLQSVKSIVEAESTPVIIVVSALGGVTDMLINTAKSAAAGNIQESSDSFEKIRMRHLDVIEGMVADDKREDVLHKISGMLEELANIFKGVSLLKDLSPRSLDTIVSYGERMSSYIISNIIADGQLFDSREFIKTTNQFGKHVLSPETNALVESTFSNAAFKVAVVPGFISTDINNGDVTNLGRGGSDYTAAIIAATLDAEILEIWTDVDGFLTADPRVISNTYVIDHLTFVEAMELCNFGAKVVYPPTIYPVFHKNIPILIKNTFNPSAPGTLISATREAEEARCDGKAIKGISSISDTCLITVSGLGMVGIVGVNARIFNSLAKEGVSVFLVSQASSENTTSFAVRNEDAAKAVAALEKEFYQEMASGEINPINAEHNLATVAVVGENMRRCAGVAGRLFNTLGRNGINVKACAQGASETNISFVIKLSDQRKALNVIHDSFFLSDTQVLNIFIIGIGNIGRHLLQQLARQQETLLRDKALKLEVVGIANSRKAIFNREGIELDGCIEKLNAEGHDSTPEYIAHEVISMNIFNSVFVDCTSSKDIAALYDRLLSHNINVVAANKIAASGRYYDYAKLKSIARSKDVKYLFETNVGAGLPIINTINSLINSGDRILKIEAVLSGTLNFIFNSLAKEVPISMAIKEAMTAGYSEPDPRVDLSGTDVMRKLVILAREAGYCIELDNIVSTPLLPEKMFEGTVDQFLEGMKLLDDDFEKQRIEAEKADEKFRFVARLDNGKGTVGLNGYWLWRLCRRILRRQ